MDPRLVSDAELVWENGEGREVERGELATPTFSGKLQLGPLHHGSAGNYRCRVVTPWDEAVSEPGRLALRVGTVISLPPSDVRAGTGESAEFRCQVLQQNHHHCCYTLQCRPAQTQAWASSRYPGLCTVDLSCLAPAR